MKEDLGFKKKKEVKSDEFLLAVTCPAKSFSLRWSLPLSVLWYQTLIHRIAPISIGETARTSDLLSNWEFQDLFLPLI